MGRSVGKVGEVVMREVIKDNGKRGRLKKAVQGQLDGSSVRRISNILIVCSS